MRPAPAARLARGREQRLAAGRQRSREPLARAGPAGVRRAGARLVNFCANDYLGLADHPAIARALAGAAAAGVGAGASPLVSGYDPRHRALERRLADFLGFDDAVVVASGYQANLALGQTLLGRGDAVVADRLNHASLNDAVRLVGARIRRYRHADPAHAGSRISAQTRWLVSDGVFSMDGDLAPLGELVALADRSGAGLWLDDAHGFGVLGASGRGLLEHCGLAPGCVDALVVTFGKALGTQGAAVLGDAALIDALINQARSIIYSTAPAPAMAAATTRALELIIQQPWRRKRLAENVARFRERIGPLASAGAPGPIQPVMVGDNRRALAIAERLAGEGFLVRAIRPPTVPEGTARLRVTLSTAHAPEQIDRLAHCLNDCVDQKLE